MATSLVLVRHARPYVAPEAEPGAWRVTKDGIEAAQLLGRVLSELAPGRRDVVASTELKAISTAEALGLGSVRTDERLCEVSRPWSDGEAAFQAQVAAFLRGEEPPGWEARAHAVTRFAEALDTLGKGTVVVSHGTVMTAWLATIAPDVDPVLFWKGLDMPDAWQVEIPAGVLRRVSTTRRQ